MYKEDFINYIQFEKRYSNNTIISYKSDLSQFTAFLLKEFNTRNIHEANNDMIRSWIISLIEEGISTRSVNRKIATLNNYFKYLIKAQNINTNPINKIVLPKASKRLPVFVEQKNMKNLFEEINFSEDFIGIRDRLTLELFYATGMRLSELINIKEQDIDFRNNTIKVLGKGSKERIIPIYNNIKELILKYINKKVESSFTSEYLVLTNKGEKLYTKFVYRLVYNYLSMITTISKKSPHVLRHTFATHMLNNGAEINAVKEILGHSSLAATQVYTHNTIENLINIYNQSHPKA